MDFILLVFGILCSKPCFTKTLTLFLFYISGFPHADP